MDMQCDRLNRSSGEPDPARSAQQPRQPRPPKLLAWSPAALACCAVLLLLSACGRGHQASQPKLPAVTVMQPLKRPVTDSIDLTGTVNPSRSVDLVARVVGYLQSVNFKDGALVEAGQLLFVIEPEPYEQQLALAQASLERAQAEYDRQLGLVKDNATSVANVERWRSERDQAHAQVELAKINLGYTRVTAPFGGRIGRRLVDPGNLVGPNANTKLATLDQLTPIYIYCNLNERDALQLQTRFRATTPRPREQLGRLPVFAGLQNQEGFPLAGVLDFVDVGLSPSSGTIQVRAVLPNEDKSLVPGLFARLRIPLGQPEPMLVLPPTALANDQEGDFALVLGPGDIVTRRSVVKGPLTPEGYAIRSGIQPEDRVIINGQLNARIGAKVRPEMASAQPAAAPNSPGSK